MAGAKADITRLEGEKEVFEQSDAPKARRNCTWNYARALESQIKGTKDGLREKLKIIEAFSVKLKLLGKNTKAAETVASLSGEGPKSIARAKKKGLPIAELEEALHQNKTAVEGCVAEIEQLTAQLDAIEKSCEPERERIDSIEEELAPYEQIKKQLAEARARYRTLTDEFVNELKSRCGAMNDDQKRVLVLELFAQDVQSGLDAAVAEKRQDLVRLIEGLWNKYRVTMTELRDTRGGVEGQLTKAFSQLGYS